MYLKTSDPETDPREIEDAFNHVHGGVPQAFFEHGQWFVYESESGDMWSAHDAEGNAGWICHGYCFEELG